MKVKEMKERWAEEKELEEASTKNVARLDQEIAKAETNRVQEEAAHDKHMAEVQEALDKANAITQQAADVGAAGQADGEAAGAIRPELEAKRPGVVLLPVATHPPRGGGSNAAQGAPAAAVAATTCALRESSGLPRRSAATLSAQKWRETYGQ